MPPLWARQPIQVKFATVHINHLVAVNLDFAGIQNNGAAVCVKRDAGVASLEHDALSGRDRYGLADADSSTFARVKSGCFTNRHFLDFSDIFDVDKTHVGHPRGTYIEHVARADIGHLRDAHGLGGHRLDEFGL